MAWMNTQQRTLSASQTFAGNPLDRLSERRDDASLLAGLARHEAARYVLINEAGVLFRRRADQVDPWFARVEAESLAHDETPVLLGQDARGPVYALALPEHPEVSAMPLDMAERTDLRSLAQNGALDQATLAILAQAKSILYWHASHGFCARCGAPTRVAAAGWRRECGACGTHHFPRTDPVVIMLVTDGERCLLGRQARFAQNMYSALAGFLEPGETIEDAVRREVREETGIVVGSVAYLASQPWPFPSSLMIGCLAQALSTQITLDCLELEDARWFTRDEAVQMLAERHPQGVLAPKPLAIAHHLLMHWVA